MASDVNPFKTPYAELQQWILRAVQRMRILFSSEICDYTMENDFTEAKITVVVKFGTLKLASMGYTGVGQWFN